MFRIGIGYDIHPLRHGNKGLYIGGVRVSNEFYSEGHSDGDVLIHAVVDAILGAAGKGNIGILFPETKDNLNRRSIEFLEIIRTEILNDAFELVNIDSVVIVEQIRLMPYLEEMVKNVARALGVGETRISIKPKSGNSMFKDSIQAYATCLLNLRGGKNARIPV
ncbi:2-C-methyl-D-erythritol 2,4-cyclodiphosphate synthase [Kosmotoga pacifica]|uniref:2-C-methyl-D-erythritol 2,4-cyclodiphosphate synthase n=1 Tax=Kosmotoga pacifica TaxID=1330330 RepID=A0A0G2ZGJ2_9BACT|nr:2-C-methyl-D-erythritol 2,4-cyclodiphosphate synthase [Kosmotoga pacifica]AKI97918.1 2-C-methyl-D-erythritol 2,4-cyclodiphosphate synthase [Kosmotoga pacifica]